MVSSLSFFCNWYYLTLASRLFKFFFVGQWSDFVNDVILDVFSELGIAIFGGAITAFILENLQRRQYKENVAFRNEILKIIKESENNKVQ